MTSPDAVPLGQYQGFSMESFSKEFRITLKGALTHTTLGTDIFGNILRLDNLLGGMEERLIACREELENVNVHQMANVKQEVEKPCPQEDELKTTSARLDELNILLNMDQRENEIGRAVPMRDDFDRER